MVNRSFFVIDVRGTEQVGSLPGTPLLFDSSSTRWINTLPLSARGTKLALLYVARIEVKECILAVSMSGDGSSIPRTSLSSYGTILLLSRFDLCSLSFITTNFNLMTDPHPDLKPKAKIVCVSSLTFHLLVTSQPPFFLLSPILNTLIRLKPYNNLIILQNIA